MLPENRHAAIGFRKPKPSNQWVAAFARRNNLQIMGVQMIDDKRVNTMTAENLTEHVYHVEAAITRFNIRNPRYIFNKVHSGPSFAKMKGRSLRNGMERLELKLLQKALFIQENLGRVTVMSATAAHGTADKPVVVFSGTLAHYRKVGGQIQ